MKSEPVNGISEKRDVAFYLITKQHFQFNVNFFLPHFFFLKHNFPETELNYVYDEIGDFVSSTVIFLVILLNYFCDLVNADFCGHLRGPAAPLSVSINYVKMNT